MLDEEVNESSAVKPYNYSSLPKTGGTYKDQVKLKEQNLYGSPCAGIRLVDLLLTAKDYTFNSYNGLLLSGSNTAQVSNPASQTSFVRMVGQKVYEMANHLGNVLVTVTDVRSVIRIVSSRSIARYGTNNAVHTIDVILDQNNTITNTVDNGWSGQALIPTEQTYLANNSDNGPAPSFP